MGCDSSHAGLVVGRGARQLPLVESSWRLPLMDVVDFPFIWGSGAGESSREGRMLAREAWSPRSFINSCGSEGKRVVAVSVAGGGWMDG